MFSIKRANNKAIFRERAFCLSLCYSSCPFDISVLWFLSLKDSCSTSGINQKRKSSYPVGPGPGAGMKGDRSCEKGRKKDPWGVRTRPNTINEVLNPSGEHRQNREASLRRKRWSPWCLRGGKEDPRRATSMAWEQTCSGSTSRLRVHGVSGR